MKRISILLSLLATAAVAQTPNHLDKLDGKAMPKFSLPTLSGKKLTNAGLKGKVVLFDFWATWCGPCKAASPTMQALHKKYGGKGLVVVGAITNDGAPAAAKTKSAKYQKEHKYGYTFSYDNDKLANELGIRGIPAFVIVGRDGKIAKGLMGWSDEVSQAMESAIKTALAK